MRERERAYLKEYRRTSFMSFSIQQGTGEFFLLPCPPFPCFLLGRWEMGNIGEESFVFGFFVCPLKYRVFCVFTIKRNGLVRGMEDFSCIVHVSPTFDFCFFTSYG